MEKYDQSSNLWNCNLMMYVLLCGHRLFLSENKCRRTREGSPRNFGLNVSGWKNISENAKGLIRTLLEMNPEDNDNAKRTPNHDHKSCPRRATGVLLQEGFVDYLRSLSGQTELIVLTT